MTQPQSNIHFNLTIEDMSVKICQLLESRTPSSVPIEFKQKRLDTIPSHELHMGKDGRMRFTIEKAYSNENATQDFTRDIEVMILQMVDRIESELVPQLIKCGKKVEKIFVYGFFGEMKYVVHKRYREKKKDAIYFVLKEPFLLYGFSVSNSMDVSK